MARPFVASQFVQVVERTTLLCVILFLASTSFNFAHHSDGNIWPSAEASSSDTGGSNSTNPVHHQQARTSTSGDESARATSSPVSSFVTGGDHAVGGGTSSNDNKTIIHNSVRRRNPPTLATASERLDFLNGGANKQQAVGKIQDKTSAAAPPPPSEGETSGRHHSLAPRHSGSTGLARLLLVAPRWQARAGRSERQSTSRSGPGEETRLEQQANRIESSSDVAVASCNGGGAVQRQSRHFGGVLRGARGLLTSGLSSLEQRAGGLLSFGSNFLAALIPLASLVSGSTSGGSQANATKPSRGTGLAGLIGPPQKLVQYAIGSGGVQNRVEYVMDLLERSIEHLPNFPRLHPQECVKRSICEAHNEPTKYGAIGLTLRLLFPATNSSAAGSEAGQESMEFKVINKYRHAAGYGLARRLDPNAANQNVAGAAVCKEKYEDCLVSLLDLAQRLVDLFVA